MDNTKQVSNISKRKELKSKLSKYKYGNLE